MLSVHSSSSVPPPSPSPPGPSKSLLDFFFRAGGRGQRKRAEGDSPIIRSLSISKIDWVSLHHFKKWDLELGNGKGHLILSSALSSLLFFPTLCNSRTSPPSLLSSLLRKVEVVKSKGGNGRPVFSPLVAGLASSRERKTKQGGLERKRKLSLVPEASGWGQGFMECVHEHCPHWVNGPHVLHLLFRTLG